MPPFVSLNSEHRYELKVYGQPDDSWLDWFEEAECCVEKLADGSEVTTFSNIVMDQAGLVGLIRRLHGHGIVLLSIQQVETAPPPKDAKPGSEAGLH